jgi:hypothetical protein
MPLISGRHNRRQVVFEIAVVGVSRETEDYVTGGLTSLSVLSETLKALVDTGATASSITPAAAQRLRLRPAGKRDIITGNGQRRSRFYEFQVALIGDQVHGASGAPSFYVLPEMISGNEFNADGLSFDILLGMDVISQGDLIIRRDGSFTFEF